MSAPCTNVEWAAENGESIEWARAMWWCDCSACVAFLSEADSAPR